MSRRRLLIINEGRLPHGALPVGAHAGSFVVHSRGVRVSSQAQGAKQLYLFYRARPNFSRSVSWGPLRPAPNFQSERNLV